MKRYIADLIRHKDLLFWLAAKEIKVRYKLPLLGFLWALIVPLLLSAILWLVFTYVIKIPMAQHPFFLFLIAGMFPWTFFAQSVSNATMSVLDAGALVKNAAFPRALIPLAIIFANLFNFLLALGVVIIVIICAGHPITPWLALLPVAVLLELALTAGVVFLVAGLQVQYRDVKYFTEVALLLWFYVTPIFYPLSFITSVPAALKALYFINPFVGVIEFYRLVLLGGTSDMAVITPLVTLGNAAGFSIGILWFGFSVFRHHEPAFSDWVTG